MESYKLNNCMLILNTKWKYSIYIYITVDFFNRIQMPDGIKFFPSVTFIVLWLVHTICDILLVYGIYFDLHYSSSGRSEI